LQKKVIEYIAIKYNSQSHNDAAEINAMQYTRKQHKINSHKTQCTVNIIEEKATTQFLKR